MKRIFHLKGLILEKKCLGGGGGRGAYLHKSYIIVLDRIAKKCEHCNFVVKCCNYRTGIRVTQTALLNVNFLDTDRL